jgi:hypothetical protein
MKRKFTPLPEMARLAGLTREAERLRAEAMEVLRLAEILLKKGWTKGAMARDESGAELTLDMLREQPDAATSYCLTGAIWAAEGSDMAKMAAFMLCFNAGKSEYALEHLALISFNDAIAKTQEEVVKLVQKARGL